MMKKLVSLLLTLALALSICSFGALAEEAPVSFSIGLRVSTDFNPDGNALVDAINKATNSNIDWIVWPSSNWAEKRNVSLASNDYPDVIIVNERKNDPMYTNMVRAGKIIPLDDYIANAPNIQKYTLDSAWIAQCDPDDGKQYTIPRCTIIREDYMMVRKDWMDELGIEKLETVDDWLAYAKAVATQDPDHNGVNDTYGVTSRGGINELVSPYFTTAFHANDGWYDDGTGTVFNGKYAKDGRFKKVLAFYRQMHEDGSIDPEFLTYKGYYEDKFEQGVSATYWGFISHYDRELMNLRKLYPDADLAYIPYPEDAAAGYENETPVLTNSGVYYFWAITDKGADRAQHIVDTFNWMLSDEGWEMLRFGVEGVHYVMKDGQREFTDLYSSEQITKNVDIMMLRRPLDQDFWLKKLVPEVYDYQLEWYNKSTSAIWDNYQISGLLGFTATNEVAFKATDRNTTEEPTLIAEIITGEKPLEAWDEFLTKVYDSGYQEIVDEYNAYYAAHKE